MPLDDESRPDVLPADRRVVTDFIEPRSSVVVRPYCPSCEPDTDPTRDLVELRWFEPDELPPPAKLAFTHYPAVLSAALRHEHP